MSYPPELLSWTREVSSHLPHLTSSQARVLAWYSLAVTLVQSSGLSHVAYFLACLLGQEENTVRQRLREVVYESEQKRGTQRREVDVVLCFAPLLKWVLTHWRSPDAVLCLALDATTLRQTFTVLSISVLVGRCAIPIAWTVLPATQPGAWKPCWQGLLGSLHVPSALTVLVMADRGLYAQWLFAELVTLGWHPLLRIKAQGWVHVHETNQRLPLAQLANACSGKWWHGQVTCFSGQQRLNCTLLGLWDVHQQDVWLLVTDLPPAHVSPTWYALRMWIEFGFKALKSAGFHWERTRMHDPARAERLWLVLALAALRLALLTPEAVPRFPQDQPHYPRLTWLKQALLRQLAAFIRHTPLPGYPLRMQALPPAPCLEFVTQLKTYP
jgi:hypothetical protein